MSSHQRIANLVTNTRMPNRTLKRFDLIYSDLSYKIIGSAFNS